VTLGLAQEYVWKVFFAEREGEVGEEAHKGKQNDEGNPEDTLLPIEGLREDAGDDASQHAGPDEEEEEDYPTVPFGGLKAETVKQMGHGREKGSMSE